MYTCFAVASSSSSVNIYSFGRDNIVSETKNQLIYTRDDRAESGPNPLKYDGDLYISVYRLRKAYIFLVFCLRVSNFKAVCLNFAPVESGTRNLLLTF